MDTNFRRIYAIPDIHGMLTVLERGLEMMEKDGYDPQKDALVFTGDLIDRGPNSYGVVEKVISLVRKNPKSVFAIRGNHEDLPLNFYIKKTNSAFQTWRWNGMASTLKSYPKQSGLEPIMTREHLAFFQSRPYYIEIQGFFFSHAPVPMESERLLSNTEYKVEELTWNYLHFHEEIFTMPQHPGPLSNGGAGAKHLIGICGHIHRGRTMNDIRQYPQYRLLDCGCGSVPGFGRLAIHECISGNTMYVDTEKV